MTKVWLGRWIRVNKQKVTQKTLKTHTFTFQVSKKPNFYLNEKLGGVRCWIN